MLQRLPLSLLLLPFLILPAGCDPKEERVTPQRPPEEKSDPTKSRRVKRSLVGKNVYLEIDQDTKKRRVLISAKVCLRKGPLELLLTQKGAKEHESILAADVDAKELHRALLVAGAKPGAPVVFEPKYKAAHGDKIKVSLMYEKKKGQPVTIPAQDWIFHSNKRKVLQADWVFAGSQLVPNPLEPKKPVFLANQGDLICVSNFETALLDLPVHISNANATLVYEAYTKRIPPLETPVTVILEKVEE